MIGPPPGSTLFPYTTLFRSGPRGCALRQPEDSGANYPRRARSEEHTSELQSHDNLVCRLLLEKKTTLTLPAMRSRGPPPHQRARAPRAWLGGCGARGARGPLRALHAEPGGLVRVFFFNGRGPARMPPFPPRAALPT